MVCQAAPHYMVNKVLCITLQTCKFWQFGCSQYILKLFAKWNKYPWFSRWEDWGD